MRKKKPQSFGGQQTYGAAPQPGWATMTVNAAARNPKFASSGPKGPHGGNSSSGGNMNSGRGKIPGPKKQQGGKHPGPKNPKMPGKPKQGNRNTRPLDPNAYGDVLNYNQALALAKQTGGLQYNPAIQNTKDTLHRTPGWFQDYRNTLANANQQTQQMSQPVVAQAAQRAQGEGQTVLAPGADQQAAQNDQLAASARGALGNAFVGLLQNAQLADNSYFQKQAAASKGAQIQATSDLRNQLGTQKNQRSLAIADNLDKTRQSDRQYGLEVQTLLSGNQQKQLAARLGAKTDIAKLKATTRTADTKFTAQYGVSQQTWRNMKPTERLAWKKAWNKSPQSPSDRLTNARLGYFQKHGYFPRTGAYHAPSGSGSGSGKDPFGNTPRQQRSATSAWVKTRSVAGQVVAPTDTWKDVYGLLIQKFSSTDSDILKAAAMRVTRTHIPPGVLNSLRKQGVNVSSIKNPPKRRPRNAPGTTGVTPGPNGQMRPG